MRIVLVEPQHPGNIGAVARAMANFGLNDLAMVNGCELADESYARSKSGRPILENSKRYNTIEESIGDLDLVFASTSRIIKVNKPKIMVVAIRIDHVIIYKSTPRLWNSGKISRS